MAINSLHFISLTDITKQLNNFSNIIKPGGRGFITFNVKRMIEVTKPSELIPNEQLSSHIKQQVDLALSNVLAYDDYIFQQPDVVDDFYLNGHIRIVFEKEK